MGGNPWQLSALCGKRLIVSCRSEQTAFSAAYFAAFIWLLTLTASQRTALHTTIINANVIIIVTLSFLKLSIFLPILRFEAVAAPLTFCRLACAFIVYVCKGSAFCVRTQTFW